MVSSTNVDSSAANNVTLQHYGPKVVYGHVMTNSGRRILIQITFDVRSVRKPLLSTSALKRRGVTIIFNHDYDRIFFETRQCIWYLTNVISTCASFWRMESRLAKRW